MLTRSFSAKHSAGVAESAESVRTSSGDAWVTVSGVVIIRCSPLSVCLGSCGGSPLLRRSRHHDRHPPKTAPAGTTPVARPGPYRVHPQRGDEPDPAHHAPRKVWVWSRNLHKPPQSGHTRHNGI